MNYIIFFLIMLNIASNELRIKNVASVGSNDQFMFVGLSNILFDEKDIYLSDQSGFTIYNFSTDLKLKAQVGQNGKGPAEFVTGPLYMGLDNDTLFVFDGYGNRTVHLFSKKLKYHKSKHINDILRAAIIRNNFRIFSLWEFDTKKMLTFFNINFEKLNSIKIQNLADFAPLNLFQIELDKEHNLIVQYQFRNLIQVYNKSGKLISEFSIENIKHKPEFKKLKDSRITPFKKKNPKTASIFNNPPINGSTLYKAIPDNSGRLFIQGGRYNSDIWKTVFITDYNGKLLNTIQIDEGEIIAGFDYQNYLYTFAEESTVLRKYKILFEEKN